MIEVKLYLHVEEDLLRISVLPAARRAPPKVRPLSLTINQHELWRVATGERRPGDYKVWGLNVGIWPVAKNGRCFEIEKRRDRGWLTRFLREAEERCCQIPSVQSVLLKGINESLWRLEVRLHG